MAGFSEQRQQLRNALVSAGIGPDAATQIANILGNSAQAMRHAGPVEVDSTPADLRSVGPDQRRVRFPNLDFREGDPDPRPQRVASSEERKEKEPEPNVLPVIAPQQTDATFRVAGGSLTDVAGNGQNVSVNVRNVVAARPPAGLPIALLDSQANQLVGKSPRARVNQNDGTARLDIQETGREMLWNLQMLNRADYDVVTKIEFVEGRGLEVTYERIKAWNENKERVDTIPTVDQPVVSEIVNDKNGLRGRRRLIPVFSSRGESSTFFNVYRIGTFTGGWGIGTTKTVTQVWPTSSSTVTVKNLTQEIADTNEEKYVLFAARTKDAVPGSPAPSADKDAPRPILTNQPAFTATGDLVERRNDPEVEYYALEIQNAQACTAFHSLNGQRVDELTGYQPDVPSALSYAIAGEGESECLRWRSRLVTVITDVALTAYGLEFSRKQLYVLGELPAEPLLIPVTDCPDEGGGGTCDGQCGWQWNGTGWQQVSACGPTCDCNPPESPGTVVGETANTPCFNGV